MKKIAVIGVGHMGSALLEGLANTHEFELIGENPINPRVSDLSDKLSFTLVHSIAELIKLSPDFVILTTPASITMDIVSELTDLDTNSIIISAAAGHSYEEYHQALPDHQIVRCIPNIPASVNQGTTGLFIPENISDFTGEEILDLLNKLGETILVKEEQLSIVGTIGGCGPAFVDIFLDALADSGVLEGLQRKLANKLAASMVNGAATLALKFGKEPSLLKDQVCSPGGTTIKGVVSLEKNGFRNAVIEAVKAANHN